MDDKNLFDRRNGQDIRGRISTGQRSTVLLDAPMIAEEYRDYRYSEPVDKKIETDNVDEPVSKEDAGSSRLATARNTGIKDPAIEFEQATTKNLTTEPQTLASITKANAALDKAKGKSGTYDETFSFLNGVIDTRISAKQGDLMRVNIDLQEKLDFIKKTAAKSDEAKALSARLDQIDTDPEAFNATHNLYEDAVRQYKTMKPTADKYLQEMHEADKDLNDASEVSKIRSAAQLNSYLDKRSTANKATIEEKIKDIEEDQGTKRYINSVYQITPEYQEKAATTKFTWTDPSSWKYTVPQTLGSSFGFIESTAVTMAAQYGGKYLLRQIPKLGMTGGAGTLAALAVSVGSSAATVWANINARQQESNAEIFDAYKQKLHKSAEEGKFDIDAAVQEGAAKLKEQVGIDISNHTSDQVLSDMITYNINIQTPGFNKIKTEARADLDKLYDQNMALAISDVGQSLLMIPGAGSMMKRAITLNGKVGMGDDLFKFTNKVIDNTTKTIATNMSKLSTTTSSVYGRQLLGGAARATQTGLKRIVYKGITPAAKIGLSAVAEMNEEGVQYIQGRNYVADKYKDRSSNLFRAVIDNADATIDAFSGLLGISSDPALNNDVDLAQNMKLGAVVSFIMGGGAQVLMPNNDNVIKTYLDDVVGSNVAKKLAVEHIKAKEDMETIKRYAADGLNNQSKREGYINQLEEIKNNLPPGLTAEDVDIEISRAKKAFSYVDSPVMQSFASKLGIEKGTDDYNTLLALAVRADETARESSKLYNSERKKYDNLWATPNVEEFFDVNNVPVEQRPALLQQIRLETELRALDSFSDEIVELGNTFTDLSGKYNFDYDNNRNDEYIHELSEIRANLVESIERGKESFKEAFKNAPMYDRIDDVEWTVKASLPSVFLNALRAKEHLKLSNSFRGIKNNNLTKGGKFYAEHDVSRAIALYNNAQQINEEANGSVVNGNIVEEVINEPIRDDDEHIEVVAREAIKPESQGGVTTTPSVQVDENAVTPKPISAPINAEVVPAVDAVLKPATELLDDAEQVTAKVEKVPVITPADEKLLGKPNEQVTSEKSTVSNVMAADYLFNGGIGVLGSSDYLMRGISGAFTKATAEIEEIRSRHSKELTDAGIDNITDLVKHDLFKSIMSEIRAVLRSKYGNDVEIDKILDEIINHPTGLPVKLGTQLSIKLDSINEAVSETTSPRKRTAEEIMNDASMGFTDDGVVIEPKIESASTTHVDSIDAGDDSGSAEVFNAEEEHTDNSGETKGDDVVKPERTASELMDYAPALSPLEAIDLFIPDDMQPEEQVEPEYSEEDLAINDHLKMTDGMPTGEATLVDFLIPDGSKSAKEGFGLTNGTVYFSGEAMFPGFENSQKFDDLLSQPDGLVDADVRIVVGKPGAAYNEQFIPDDRSTWGEAAIYVTVHKGGKKYAGALKTLSGAIRLYESNGNEVDHDDINKLVEFRTEILEASLVAGEGAVLRPKFTKRTNGIFNSNKDVDGFAINRPLTKIKGFNIPSNIREMRDSGIEFGIGRGLKNHFYIADKDGHFLPGKGDSGKIYIYPRKSDTPSGTFTPPIKLNELKFSATPDLTDLLYHSFVEMSNSPAYYELGTPDKSMRASFTHEDLVKFLINEGEHTLVFKGNREDFEYLVSKQFYFDRSKDSYIIGDNVWTRSYLLSPKGKQEFLDYVNQNLHVNTDEVAMFESLPYKFYRTMYKHKLNELKLSKSLVFTKDDVGLKPEDDGGVFGMDEYDLDPLTHMEWMIKNGWLMSDLKDNLFRSPFLYVKGVDATIPEATQKKAVAKILSNTDPVESYADDEVIEGYGLGDPDFKKWFGLELAVPKGEAKDAARVEHTERAKKWLMNKLGLSEDQVIVGNAYLRAAANGTTVMGTAYKDAIVLADAVIEGTGYHEAFHRVSTLLLSQAQQEQLYAEYRKRHPEYKNATRLAIEEALAEDFRAFMLKREKPIYSILKWFNPIATFIRKIFKPNSINTIYNMISDGNFAKYKILPERYAEFENAYPEGLGFTVGEGDNAFSPKAFADLASYYQTIKTLASALLYKNGVRTLEDVSNIKTSILRNYLINAHNKTKNLNRRTAIKELLDNFDSVIMPDVMEELSRMSIRAIDNDRDEENENRESGNQEGIQNYDKASYEVSKKDNALAAAKMFIGTIIKVDFKYTDVDGATVRSIVPQMNALIGLPDFVDFDTSWNLMLSNLYNVENWSDVLSVTQDRAKTSPFFYQLYNQLNAVTDVNLQTQLLQTVKSNKHNMMTVKYGTRPADSGKGVQVYWGVDDSNTNRMEKTYPSVWSQNFYNSNLVSISEDGSVANKAAIKEVSDRYKSIAAYMKSGAYVPTDAMLDMVVAEMVKLLNKIGITVDVDTINAVLNDPKVVSSSDTRATAVYKLVTDVRNGSLGYVFDDNLTSLTKGPTEYKTSKGSNVRTLINAYEGLGSNSMIGLLAKHYAKLNPNPEELSVLGANNSLLYPISQNCYMSDQVRWLNLGIGVKELEKVTYCTNSMIRNALANNHAIKLNTFVNFKHENSGDKGRGYMEISPVEDYLSKMTLTANNHIILPTMADKGMWFTITGVKLFNDPIDVVFDQVGAKLMFNEYTLQQFAKVGLDELNTIIQHYNKKVKVSGNKNLEVKNYHTNNLGGRFRHFTHIARRNNGVTELVDLNKMLDDADKTGNTGQVLESLRKKYFSATSDSSVVAEMINDNLKYLMAAEVASAESLGIIKRDGDSIKNILLDPTRFNELVTHYRKTPATSAYAEHYAALTMIGNHAVNSALSIIEIEKIFTGDSAFYKPGKNKFDTSDDKIKRLSEVLSTGDNLRTEWPAGHRLENRTSFTAVELKDNEIASHQFDELKELFTKSYARKFIMEINGFSENEVDDALYAANSKTWYATAWAEAEKSATVAVGAYGFDIKKNKGNINHADAAVYISPQMYRDIMEMLGEWSPEIERAYDIMESSSDWLSNPKLYHESLEALIKPLKMMYYGQHLIPELGIQVPIFDKMAMFPMFKVMATGDNLKMYERMNATGAYAGSNKIDMVAFGSAVKVGSRNPGVFYTDAHNTEISDLNKWAVFNQEFKYLRRQLLTNPHHAERQMLGTQVAKAALSNLVMDRPYGKGKDGKVLTGAQIRDNAFGAMNRLSDLGIKRVQEEVCNEDGSVNIEKLSGYLIRNAKAKGMSSEIIDGLRVVDGKFNMPLSSLSDNKWIESAFLGLTNKESVDINLPGGAYIQMSSFGYNSVTKLSDRSYNGGNRLNLSNPDGSMDAMISINLFSHMIPNYKNRSYTSAKQWLIDNNIIGTHKDVTPVAMGYRIPTQGLSSISALRVVDVFPSNIGDTVMLPDEFTALTGSDFDIDKLFVASYNYETYDSSDGTVDENGMLRNIKKARRVEFDETLGFDGNSREATENRLLDMYMMVLTDKSNVDETKLPLDNTTAIIKDEILPIVDGKAVDKNNYSFKYVSPTFQLNKKYEYSGGKNGIGPFALNNVHHVLTQLLDFGYKYSKTLNALGFGKLSAIDSIKTSPLRRGKYGDVLTGNDGNPITETDRGERILDWLSAMINAHVDVAKDPYIIRLNVVQYTYNMANFLLRSGFGRNTFFFLPQPILKDVAKEVQKLDGKYGVPTKRSRYTLELDAVNKIKDAYLNAGLAVAKNDMEREALRNIRNPDFIHDADDLKRVMDRDFLISSIVDSRNKEKSAQYYLDQLRVLITFETLTPYAKEMSELVGLSQVDTKRFGNSLVLQRQYLYRLKAFIYNNKVFSKADLKNLFKSTFLDTKIRNSVVFNNELFDGMMITSTSQFAKQVRKVLQLVNKSDTKDDTLLKIVSNELEAMVKSEFFNGLASSEDVKGMFYGHNNMASRLSKLKSDIILGRYPEMVSPQGVVVNELLTYLSSEFKQVNDIYDSPNIISVPRTKSNDKYLEKRLTKYWEELLDSPHEEVLKFAQDLVIYAFQSSGDNYNKNSFFNLVPNSYRKALGYDSFVNSAMDKLNSGSADNNLEDLFLNTWYNNNLVPEVVLKGADLAIMSSATISGNQYPVAIMLSNAYAIGINRDKNPVYRPFIKINLDNTNNPETTVLYKYRGFYEDASAGVYKPAYFAVNKKGLYLNGKVIREYNGDESSMMAFNNLPYTFDDNLFGVSEYVDKAGSVKKKYTNVNVTNKDTRDKWKKILSELTLIEDYNVFDRVDELTYDEVMNADHGEEESFEEESSEEEVIPAENFVQKEGLDSNNSFTFKNGIVIQTPFPLNSQQEAALHGLAEFLKNPKMTNNEVTLTGYAGTGKTTIMGLFDKYINQVSPVSPKYAAVTYRANAVTQMNNPGVKTYTLHQLFGISAEVDLSDNTLDLRKIANYQKYNPKIEFGDIIIIDEASMVSPVFYEFIEKAKQSSGISVIYVGDPAQLSPVDGTKDISPVFSGKKGKVLSLTKVERTGDNPILEEATNLREGKDLSYVTKIGATNEGVAYVNDERVSTEFVNEAFKSKEFAENKLYIRVLSAVNDQISIINDRVRKAIFGRDANQLEVGDILMGYDNINITGQPEPDIINSGDYEVMSVTPAKTRLVLPKNGDVNERFILTIDTFTTKLSNILDRGKEVTVNIASKGIPIAVAQHITMELELLYKAKRLAWANHERNKATAIDDMINDIKTSFISMREYKDGDRIKVKRTLDYGYAHTIHKSQGGTYNKVLIYADTIDRFKDASTRQQLKYVAVSRAKEQVMLLTNKQLGTTEEVKPSIEPQPNDNISKSATDKFKDLVEDEHESVRVVVTKPFTKLTEEELGSKTMVTTNHSGGALGSDSVWDEIGQEYGVKSNHYYHGSKTPIGNFEISQSDFEEGKSHVREANNALNRRPDKYMDLLARSWIQVKNSDAVFAIGHLKNGIADGGTGWAVQMAIDSGKTVYVFDQKRNEWYKNINATWSKSDVPALTSNFAGIGTRNINESGKNAIRSVYEKTFNDQVVEAQAKPKTRSAEDIMNDVSFGNEDMEVHGSSVQNMVVENDGAIKEMRISERRQNLEELIQQRTDIDANALRAEFDSVVESYRHSDSDSTNNALMQLLCKS